MLTETTTTTPMSDLPDKMKCAACQELGNYTDEEYEIFKRLLPRVVLLKTGSYLRGANKVAVTKTAVYSATEYIAAGFRSKTINSIGKGLSWHMEIDDILQSMLL